MNQQTEQPGPETVEAAIERLTHLVNAPDGHGSYLRIDDIRTVIAAASARQETGLTADELAALDALVEAWNRFCALPMVHPSDIPEAAPHIHALQEKIMARVAVRAHPAYFRTVPPVGRISDKRVPFDWNDY